ncbi:MAG: conjugal transfer protein TraF [Elusimicrobiota bacterium]
MRKTAILLAIAIISIFVSVPVCMAALDTPALIRGARPLGMGGAFVALADDHNAIFYNPAGITQRSASQFTAFELPIGIGDDIFKFIEFYNDNQDKLKDFDTLATADKISLLNEINDKITTYKPHIRFGFPNTSYISGPGFLSWGVGTFTTADIGFKFNRSLIIPSLSMWGNIDAVLGIPVAHKFNSIPSIPGFWKVPQIDIPGQISVGGTLKFIQRGKISDTLSILEFEDFSPLIQMGSGFGLDLGTLYQPNERWNYGLQITDIGGTSIKYARVEDTDSGNSKEASSDMINSEWNVGSAYIPSKIYYWPGKYINTLDRVLLAFDVRDILNSDERLLSDCFWKKLHMGAEFRWGTISLRGGYNSGYPSFGFGLGIPYVGLRMDYAFWGDELGRYAGQLPEWNHQISLALRWGSTKGRAYGSDITKKNKPAVKDTEKTEAKEEVTAPAAPAAVPAAPENAQQAAPAVAPADSNAPSTQQDITPATEAAPAQPALSTPAPAEPKPAGQ